MNDILVYVVMGAVAGEVVTVTVLVIALFIDWRRSRKRLSDWLRGR